MIAAAKAEKAPAPITAKQVQAAGKTFLTKKVPVTPLEPNRGIKKNLPFDIAAAFAFILNSVELVVAWPPGLLYSLLVLVPKLAGGDRPIGLTPVPTRLG